MLGIELISAGLVILLALIVLVQKGFQLDISQFRLEGVSAESLRLGLVLATFSFVGFESATSLGDEAKRPLRSIPRAVLASVVVPGLFFILLSYTEVLGFRSLNLNLGENDAPLAALANQAGIGALGLLISIGAAISFFACVLASVNAGSRILFTLSRHGILHASVGAAHRTNATPHVAITVISILTFIIPLGLLVTGNGIMEAYAYLGTIATFGFLLVYILVAIAAPVYLHHLNQLQFKHVAISVVAVLFMLIPIVGSLYPIPPAPFNILPYIFLGLLVLGAIWLAVVWQRSPQVIEEIGQDLETTSSQFSAISKERQTTV